MILHLLHDEKVANRMIANFEEALPGQSIYVCIVPQEDYKLRYIDAGRYNIILQVEGNQSVIDCSLVNKVFIHFLTLSKIDFCNKNIKKSAIIYWGLWGADLYNRLLFGRGYKLYASINYKLNLKATFLDLLRIVKHRLNDKKYVEFINQRITYIGGLDCDFNLVHRYLLQSPKKHFTLSAYGVDEILGPHLVGKMVDDRQNVVLCGNSASYTNNHNYLIKRLKTLTDGVSPVKMILSYGGDNNYINKVIKTGKKKLGDCFIPITEFLPLSEYNNLMASARICVYCSWRQEAVGNILVSLYLGAKVYLSKYSPLLEELRSIGYKVYELEGATKDSFYTRIPYSDQKKNRDLILLNNKRQTILNDIKFYFGE